MLAHAGTADETWSVVMVLAALWTAWVGWSRVCGRGFTRLPRAGAFGLLGVAGVLTVGAAFVPRAILGPGRAAAPRPSSTANVRIAGPADGAMVRGAELTVVLEISGGRVIEGATAVDAGDAGHIHVSIDGTLLSMTYGLEQTIPIGDLTEGPHTIEAEYVAADHGPFAPRVLDTSAFVKAAG
ncbi:MAG: hypothetical protein ABI572_06520 [Actinomycetota bacterium]